MDHKSKIIEATTTSERVKQAPGWFDTPWYYISIAYGDSQMGLLVQTDDEEQARREADQLCGCFGAMARTLAVRKVVLQ